MTFYTLNYTMSRAVPVKITKHGGRTTHRETNYVQTDSTQGKLAVDAMGDRFLWNEDLFDNSDILLTIHSTLANALFSQGFAFKRGNKFMRPTGQFKSVIRYYWRSILNKSLRFLMCNGFLVWFTYKTPEGVLVPDIPERNKLQIDWEYDTKTGVDTVIPSWNDADIKSRLYVIVNGLSTGSDCRKGRSMVDKVKGLLRIHNLLFDAKVIATHIGSRPPEVAEPSGASRKIVSKLDDMPPAGSTSQFAMTNDDALNYDAVMYNNLNSEANEAMNNHKSTSNVVIAPHLRLQMELDQPPEARFLRIPGEMKHANWNAPMPLADIPELLRNIRAQIFMLCGVPHNIQPRSTTRVAHDKETEVSQDIFNNTLRAIGEDFSTILTSMFRVLYAQDDIQISDIKRTASEQNKRVLRNGEELDVEDLFMDDNETDTAMEMILVEHALEDKEAAEQLYEQGLISSQTLYQRHRQLLQEEADERQARLAGNTNAPPPRKKIKK